MIKKLQRRLTLLVIGALILVTAGIVLSIDTANRSNIASAANAALRTLEANQGRRPGIEPRAGETLPPLPEDEGRPSDGSGPSDGESPSTAGETPPPRPEGDDESDGGREPMDGDERRALRGVRHRLDDLSAGSASLASLSNYYTIHLDGDGAVTEWSSDRSDLYSDEQIQAIADAVTEAGRDSGRVGTQFFRLSDTAGGRLLIVLDARLEYLSAARTLRVTILVAVLACLVLSAGAFMLIRRMLIPVQASFDRQKQFVWDASHEFKTPLAVISANAEVLSREIGENEYLGYIQSEVRRTDNLVQSLLTLARMDKGTVSAQLKAMNLSEALLGVALPFESTVFEEGRTLEIDVPDGVWCRGDEAMLQQLAVILLSNALKYSDPGGEIRLSLAQKGRACVMTVFNTGPGIEPDKLTRIFDRFYRADPSHNSQVAGNGLGLAIARNIVEAHRGHIRAESEWGRSATFVVTLPAHAPKGQG